MNTTELPVAVKHYFDAKNAHDAAAVAAAFEPDGTVHDEGEEHRGAAAIRTWAEGVIERYNPAFAVRSVSRGRGDATVVAEVSGTFDGSPADITYVFDLADDGLIRSMRVP